MTFGKHRPSGADHEERPPELVGLAAGDFLPADGPCHPAMLWAMVGATTFAGLLGMWLLQGRIRERRETPK